MTAMIADCGSSVPREKPSAFRPACSFLLIFPQMLALVLAVHQLADRGRGGGDDARRERGGEDIGPADQAQDFELGMVRDAETADGADRLGEGADDEVDVVDDALGFGDSAAMLADEAHRMRFVDQDHSAKRLATGTICRAGQRRRASNRRLPARPACPLRRQCGAGAFRARRRHCGGTGRSGRCRGATVVDRRVTVDVEDDVIILAGDGRNQAEVGLVAGRKDHGMVHGVEVAERCLALLVARHKCR